MISKVEIKVHSKLWFSSLPLFPKQGKEAELKT